MKYNTFWQKLNRSAAESSGGSAAAAQTETQTTEPGAETTTEAPDFTWMPEDYRKDGQPDFTSFKAHYEDLLADQARRNEAAGDVPEDGKYDFSLPEGFDYGVELPEGIAINLDTESPLFGEFGAFLKENNVPRSVATGLTGLLAKYQAQQYADLHASATKEFETLGGTDAARNARVASVSRALETKLPADQAEALKAAVHSAAGVKALETILGPSGLTAPIPQKDAVDLDKLSPLEKLKMANEQAMQR